MADSDRKSSEDLIREANSRLRGQVTDVPESAPAEVAEPEPPVTRASEPRYETTTELPSGPIEQQPQRRAPSFGWLRWGLAALIFGGWFLFTNLDDASRDDTGEIVGGGDLDVMTLQAGDCFNDPEDFEEVVFDVAAVPCSEPHDNEVFAVQTLAAGTFTGGFPGQDALQQHSYEACTGAVFDDYVGTSYLESSLEVFTFTPTADSWDQGDRGFVCALYRLDFGKLTGTARGSGL